MNHHINLTNVDDQQKALVILNTLGIKASIEGSGLSKTKKPYKERVYIVTIGPTTPDKARELRDSIIEGFYDLKSRARKNMDLRSDVLINKNLSATELSFKVFYGAHGNSPSDVRGPVKKFISNIDSSAQILVYE